ncbi:hypothetical protein JCM9140_974 [Halalkalibacter wakoensis JCM 9140]|uniref:Uncharacterized protein n=1 Tax=Halalkalibacter wakoensis JCM 9140 TaxID=1236970 RepID=W4PZA7_9BACI|nr:hypothetical protein [Halalkalibacter wakoensis]GAE25005.1 hypothetical protein JCM9140_974 [Halalkalibacter wakoensis JCM 9140]
MEWIENMKLMFTPAHKKPVEDHIIRDKTTRNMITDTEELLVRLAKNAPAANKKKSVRRKQQEWQIKIKVTHKWISIVMMDQKHSSSPIKKRFVIVCYRKYMKAKNGIGLCKEASIRYLKDGRAHTRSIRDSSLFQSLFYRIHQLDLAFSNETVSFEQTSKELLLHQQNALQETKSNDLPFLIDEAKRYIQTVQQFSVDPLIETRLKRLLAQGEKLQNDFTLLDFEERHTVRRMFKEDIPSVIHTYLSLTLKHQLDHKEELFVALSKMELTLISYTERLETLRVERMNHLLKLQSLRYDK